MVHESRKSPSPASPHRRRRFALALVIVVGLLGIAWISRSALLAAVAGPVVRRAAGMDATWSKFELGGLSHLEIEGLRLRALRPGGLRSVEAEHAEVELDPRALFGSPLDAVRGVRARGVKIEVDAASDEAGTTGRSKGAASGARVELPGRWPRIEIEQADVDLRLDTGSWLRARGARFAVRTEGGASIVELDAARLARIVGAEIDEHPLSLRASYADGVLELERFEWDPALRFSKATLDFSKAGTVGAKAALSAFGGAGELDLRFADKNLAGRVAARGVHLGEAIRFFAPHTELELDARVDLDAQISMPLDRPGDITGRVDLDAVDADILGRRFDRVRGRILGDSVAYEARDAFLAEGANAIQLSVLRVPRRTLDVCDLVDRSLAAFEAEIDDVPALAGGTEMLARLPEHHLSLGGRLARGTLDLDRGELRVANDVIVLHAGRVPLHEDLRTLVHDTALELALTASVQDIGSAVALFWGALPEGFEVPTGAVEGHVAIAGGPRGPRGDVRLSARDLRVAGRTVDSADVEGEIDETSVTVSRLDLKSRLGTLGAHGRWLIGESRLESSAIEARIEDIGDVLPALSTHGSVRLVCAASGRLDDLSGTLSAKADGLEREGLTGDVRVEVRASHGTVSIDTFHVSTPRAELDLKATAQAATHDARTWNANVESIELRLDEDRFVGTRPFSLTIRPHGVDVRDLRLAGARGEILADVELARGEGCADVSARGVSIDPRLLGIDTSTRGLVHLDGALDAEWAAGTLRARSDGTARATLGQTLAETAAERGPDVDSMLHWSFTWKDGRLVADELAFTASREGLDPTTIDLSGSVPLGAMGAELFAPGAIEIRGRLSAPDLGLVPLPPAMGRMAGRAAAEIELKGTWSRLEGRVSFSSEQVSWSKPDGSASLGPLSLGGALDLGDKIVLHDVRLTLVAGAPVPLGMSVSPATTPTTAATAATGAAGSTEADRSRPSDSLPSTSADSIVIAGTLDVSGSIDAPFDARELLLHGRPAPSNPALALDARLQSIDLAPLARRFPAVRRAAGLLTGEAHVRGTLDAPLVEGSIAVAGGEVRTASALPAISGVEARLVFDGSRLHVERLEGEMGGAPFRVTGEFGPLGADARVDLTIAGEGLLLYRQSDATLRADAELTLKGPLDALELGGSMKVRDSRYTRKLDFLAFSRRGSGQSWRRGFSLFSLRDPPFDKLRFDVDVGTATPFLIENNVARGALRPELRLSGTGELPVLRGTIYVDPSRVLLPAGTLEVRGGRIEFRPDRPDVPDLELQAHTRMQAYDIDIHVSGPYDEPRVDLSSLPPLSREDLVLLVLTGRPPGPGASLAEGERTARDVAVYIARDVASQWLSGNADTGESLAERLEVVVGADRNRNGTENVVVRMRVSGKASERGSGMFLTGERDIYEFYNFGFRFVFSSK